MTTTPDRTRSDSSKPRGPEVKRAFIHVGAPKTGTTFIQGVLWQNRTSLRAAGLHILGQSRGDHYRAGHDIRELPYDPDDPRPDWAGSWKAMANLAIASEAANVVISDEHLASLTPEQAGRAVEALQPREVHVVYATRNLARLLPSEYQEYVKHRSKLKFAEWSKRVFASRERGPGRWFWSVHDPVDVVERWATALPITRLHVVTMPPPGSDRLELWRRFAGVVGVDPEAATEFEVSGNDSLGLAESELLRRVNVVLPEEFPRWHHAGLARDVLASTILAPRSRSGRPKVPPRIQKLVLQRTETNIAGLAAAGCEVIGDLSELRVTDEFSASQPDPTDEEVLDTAVEAISGLLMQMARMRDDRRQAEGRLRRQIQSSVPALRFRSRVAATIDRTRIGSALLTRYRVRRANAQRPT